MIVDIGKEALAKRVSQDDTIDVFKYIAIGSDGTAVQSNDSSLGTELARIEGSFTWNAAGYWTIDGTFGAGTGTGTIREVGIFNATSSGLMLARVVFDEIVKNSGDPLVISWKCTI